MKDIMLDLETFDNSPNSVIVQIGAAFFDRKTGEVGKCFKKNIDARSYEGKGLGKVGLDTIYWWLGQSDAARKSIMAEPREDVRKVMELFNDFTVGGTFIWSHATFDFVILSETFKRLKIVPNFRWNCARDIRTLIDLTGFDYKNFPREGTHHDALDDSLHQIKYCSAAIKTISVKS